MYFRIIKKKSYQKFCCCLYKYINRYAVYFLKRKSGTNHHNPCHVSHWNVEGTYDCIVLYVSVLSLALLYVSAERIHILCVFSHRDQLFNLFNYHSFAVGHVKHSQCFVFYIFAVTMMSKCVISNIFKYDFKCIWW